VEQAALCVVHLSDIHFLEDPSASQHGVRTADIFEWAIPMVNAVAPNLIVVGGDLTSDEKPASYRRARAGFARLRAPVHAIMGNHDDRSVYRSVFHPEGQPSPDPIYRAFDHGAWRFVLLDSHVPGAVEGRMDAPQLAWLDADLAAHPGRPTFAFVHHPPLAIGVRWLDNLGFLNGQDLVHIVERHPQVRAVFFGHVHQPRIWRYRGIVFASVPALAFQFSPTEQDTSGRHITQDPPAFRVIRSRQGDGFETALHYLDGRIVPDPPPSELPEYGL
jgi:Icc protein